MELRANTVQMAGILRSLVLLRPAAGMAAGIIAMQAALAVVVAVLRVCKAEAVAAEPARRGKDTMAVQASPNMPAVVAVVVLLVAMAQQAAAARAAMASSR